MNPFCPVCTEPLLPGQNLVFEGGANWHRSCLKTKVESWSNPPDTVDPLLRLADTLVTYLAHQPTERFEEPGRARDIEEIFWKVSNHLQEQLLPKEK